MTTLEIDTFPAVVIFLEALSRACKGCFYKGNSVCVTCPSSTAKSLIESMNPPTPPPDDIKTVELKKRYSVIIQMLTENYPDPLLASEFDLLECSKPLRSMTLQAMVKQGILISDKTISGSRPHYKLAKIPEGEK